MLVKIREDKKSSGAKQQAIRMKLRDWFMIMMIIVITFLITDMQVLQGLCFSPSILL